MGLGGGAGSKFSAWTFAEQGQRVAVIERKYIGGSCANIACLPSKNECADLDRVCLSGRTFQNLFLLEHLMAAPEAQGFSVYHYAEVPTGDGGLSLGQALAAANKNEGAP